MVSFCTDPDGTDYGRSYDEHTHFVNSFGKIQRIPLGYTQDGMGGIVKAKSGRYYHPKPQQETTEVTEYVEFELNDNQSDRVHILESAERAFGMSTIDAARAFNSSRKIKCRLDQFARFLIYRAEGVNVNQFRSLNAKIVTDKPVVVTLDVRGN